MTQLLVTTFLILVASTAAPAICSPEGATAVRVSGTLERKTFPGPPNYESVREGDRPETYFVLRLATPICLDLPEQGQRESADLQLFLQAGQYPLLEPKLGSKLVMTGTLWPAETGHHHTPLLFTPTDLPPR